MTDTAIKLVLMARDANEFPAPHSATVHPDEVENFKAGGWTVSAGMATPTPEPVNDDVVEIHADWQSLQWKKRVALAKKLGWVDGEPTTEQADGWIADILVQRERALPRDDLNGLSLQEVHAALTAAGLEWDAETSPTDLLALYDLAQADKAEG